jgi:hypothetical protein
VGVAHIFGSRIAPTVILILVIYMRKSAYIYNALNNLKGLYFILGLFSKIVADAATPVREINSNYYM